MKVYLLTYDIKSDTSNGYALVTADSPTLALAILNSQGLYFGTYNIISTREVIGEGTEVFPCYRILTEGIISANTNTDIYSKKEIDALLGDKANLVHSHTINDITELPATLANKQNTLKYIKEDTTNVSVTIDSDAYIDNLEVYNGTTIDGGLTVGYWKNVYSVNEKETLQDALDDKQDTLVSGTNIKTINGNSVLGSGNIEIEGGTTDAYTKAETDALLEDKADKSALLTTVTEDTVELSTTISNRKIFLDCEELYKSSTYASEDALVTYSEVTAQVNKKQDTLTFDDAPTSGSKNPVRSGGVYTSINSISGQVSDLAQKVGGKADASTTYTKTEVDDKLSSKATTAELLEVRNAMVDKGDLTAYLTREDAAGIYATQTSLASKLDDAPSDGAQYARKDGAWAVVEGGGGQGIPETEDVTITLSKDDGTLLSGLKVDVLVDGNTTTSLTTDDSGECTISISGGSTYMITTEAIDGYYTALQQYTFVACKDTRAISIVYSQSLIETLIIAVAYSVKMYGQPNIYATQKVIYTNLTTGESVHYSINSSNKLTLEIPYGTHYSLSLEDFDGYYVNPLTQEFVANKTARSVNLYYRPTSAGFYFVYSDGTEELYDPNADYSDFDNTDVVGLGIRTKALINADCCFMIAKTISQTSTLRWGSQTTISGITLVQTYASASVDYNGKENTALIVSVMGSNTGFSTVTSKTLTVGDVSKSGFVGAAGQEYIIWSNKDTIISAMEIIGATYEINTFFTANSWTSSQSTQSNGVYVNSGSPTSFQSMGKTSTLITLPLFEF